MAHHPAKAIVALLVCLPLCVGWSHGRGPVTYYVDSSAGSDSNTGTSPSQAWASLTKTNGFLLFHSGDTVALNGAATFSGSLAITEANAPSNLTIASYNAGQSTISSGSSSCVTVTNFQWITINNIKCQGSGGAVAAVDGIKVTNTGGSNAPFLGGPTIINNTVAGYGNTCVDVVNGGGGIAGIAINGNTINDCAGKNSAVNQEVACVNVVFSNNNSITINHNTIFNCHGANTGHSNMDAKGNGIEVNGGVFAAISNNLIHDFGTLSDACGGPVGVLIANVSAATVAFNEVYNGSTNGGCDGDALDFDQGTQNSVMEYNYVHHNTTTGLLGGDFGAIAVANLTYRFNIIEASNGEDGIQLNCNTFISNSCMNIQIYNNTIFMTNGFNAIHEVQGDSASFVSFAVANNILYTALNAASLDIPVKPTGTLGVTGNDWFTANNNGGATMSLQDGIINANNLGQAQNNGYETTPPGTIPPTGTRVGTAVNPGLNAPGAGVTCNGYLPPCPMGYQLSVAATGTVKGQGLNLTSIYGSNVGVQDFYGNALTAGSLPIGAAANR